MLSPLPAVKTGPWLLSPKQGTSSHFTGPPPPCSTQEEEVLLCDSLSREARSVTGDSHCHPGPMLCCCTAFAVVSSNQLPSSASQHT